MSWNKYGMSANGSKLEKAIGEMLYLREKAGELCNVQEQVRVQICCKDPECPSKMRINSIVDFSAFDIKQSKTIYIEAKGFETEAWRIKRRLWMHNGAGDLELHHGSCKNHYLKETLSPK